MRGFGTEREEIPDVVGLLDVAVWVALLRVDEIRKLERITDEEDRRVVADQVVVPVLGVELDRNSPGVAHRVSRALLARHRRETHKYFGSLSDRRQQFSLGPRRHICQHLEI